MTNTLNTPIESIELEYSLQADRYGFRPDSGGDGEHRGGLGLERSLTVKTDSVVSLLTECRRYALKRAAGGENGATGVNCIDGDTVPAKCTRDIPEETTVSVYTPGGGGYGDAGDRGQDATDADAADGNVPQEE